MFTRKWWQFIFRSQVFQLAQDLWIPNIKNLVGIFTVSFEYFRFYVPLRGHPKTCRGRISWWQLNLERRSQLHNSQTCSVGEALDLAIGTSWYFWHSAIRLRVSLLFERSISDNPDHYMTAMEQHRLEKRRMHRHSCVSAILCERIYSETAQIGKAENA